MDKKDSQLRLWYDAFIVFLLFNYIISTTHTVSHNGTFSTMLYCYVPSMSCCHCFLLKYKATANKVWHCNTIHLIVPLSSLWKLSKIYAFHKHWCFTARAVFSSLSLWICHKEKCTKPSYLLLCHRESNLDIFIHRRGQIQPPLPNQRWPQWTRSNVTERVWWKFDPNWVASYCF